MAQKVVGQDDCHHGLADGNGTDADTGIVPPSGRDFRLVAKPVDGATGRQDRRGGLDGKTHDDRLARGDAAQNAACGVGKKVRPAVVAHTDLVGVLFTGELGRRHAGADLDALDGVDAHHGAGQILIEPAVDRGTPSRWYTLGHHLDDGAHRGAGLAHLVEVARPGVDDAWIGCEERVVVHLRPTPARTVYRVAADLDERASNADRAYHFTGHGAGSNAHGGLPRAGATSAPIVADAVLLPIGEIGMPGSKLVLDVGIVARPLVDIVDDERNGCPRGHLPTRIVIEHAR